MGDWFDDFLVMKMIEDDAEEEQEDDLKAEEALEALNNELSTLQDELLTVECNEPDDCLSDSYTRWEARRDLLEEQISAVESEISELEERLGL